MAQLIFEPIDKKSGIGMGFKGHRWRNSFSRYGNEILKAFFPVYVCQNMLKNEIFIQKILPTISFKTFSVSFLRRGTEILKDLNAI